MKKFFINVGYWAIINAILFFAHFFAFVGVAFNDTGEFYSSFRELIPYLFSGLSILFFGTIILSLLFKKKKYFNIIQFYILQLTIFILWIMYYSSNLIK